MNVLKKISSYYGKFYSLPPHTPTRTVPDGPLFGNGDLGVVVGGDERTLRFYLTKNDFWCAAPAQTGGGIKSLGVIELHLDAPRNLTFYAEQHILHGDVYITLRYDNEGGKPQELNIHAYAPYQQNIAVVETTCSKGNPLLNLDLIPMPDFKADFSHTSEGNTVCITKNYHSPDLTWETWACAGLKVLEKTVASFRMNEGETVTAICCAATNHDTEEYKELVHDTLSKDFAALLPAYRKEHEAWWDSFWQTSGVSLPDLPDIEEFWYGSHYLMACCSKKDKFAPGIFGNWVTTEAPNWAGDYHLNYNYQAPWWGCFSSNKIELTEPYDQPLLDYIPAAKKNAREELNCHGLYAKVGIGPKGYESSMGVCPDGTLDSFSAYWGQKSNAAYAAINMSMRFYSTYDKDYARSCAYPYLTEAAAFWEDYLKFEDGRYVIYNDCIHENAAAGLGVYEWVGDHPKDYSDDFNPILTLGLLRVLFQTLIDVCDYLDIDHEQIPKWRHILEHLSEFPTQLRDGRKVFRYTERGMDWADGNSLGVQHIFPCGTVGLSSDSELLKIGWDTIDLMGRWQDFNAFPTFYAAAARIGYSPEVILSNMQKEIQTHSFPNYFIFYGGGGIECCSTIPGCINEMLLQSYDGVLRFFPVWDNSMNAEFQQLRCYGAFLVSASMKDGEISPIELYSEKGRPCRIVSPWKEGLTVTADGQPVACYTYTQNSDVIYKFTTTSDTNYLIKHI